MQQTLLAELHRLNITLSNDIHVAPDIIGHSLSEASETKPERTEPEARIIA